MNRRCQTMTTTTDKRVIISIKLQTKSVEDPLNIPMTGAHSYLSPSWVYKGTFHPSTKLIHSCYKSIQIVQNTPKSMANAQKFTPSIHVALSIFTVVTFIINVVIVIVT